MKLLTFTDLHDDKQKLKELVKRASKSDIDFIICAGDISNFGSGLRSNLEAFDKIGKKFYFIPGNHEEGLDSEKFMRGLKNCIDFHKEAIEMDDYVFLGYGGGGFSQQDPIFRKIARKWYGDYKGKKIVLVTHGPPVDTTIDDLSGHHVGSIDYRKFIERIQPRLVICGHLHDTVGETDTIGKTKLIHPGWDGMIIELS